MSSIWPILLMVTALANPQAAKGSLATASFDQIVQRATEARKEDRLLNAIDLYRQAVTLRPSWAEGWWYLSTILYDVDRYEEARDSLRRFIPLQAKFGPGYAMLGLCEFQLRDYERAQDHLLRAQSLGFAGYKELQSVALYHLAILLTRSERFEEGGLTLSLLIKGGNQSPSIIEALGLNVLRMPFLPAEMPPDKRELVYRAGKASLDMINHLPEEARRGYEELIGRYPNERNVHYAFGVLLLEIEPDAGIRELKREIEISPRHVAARMQIALEYVKRGDFQFALPYAEEAVALEPQSFATHRTLGRVLLVTGDNTRAMKELEQAVKLAPRDAEARYALSTAYQRVGRKEDAARERAEFVRLNKQAPRPSPVHK